MSWATWTDAFDTDGQFGPGTRRGSAAVLPGQISRGSRGSMSEDVEKQDGPLDETFTWAAGYNEGETPHNMPEFGNDIPVPQSPVRKDRHVSEVPSNRSLAEDEEDQGPGFNPLRTSLEGPPRGSSSFSRSIPRTSIVLPESPRRASLALPSPLNPSSRRGSAGILLATPPKRNISISIEEPIIAGRRRSSVHSNGSSQGESRRGSGIHHGPTRKSSGLLQVTLPVIDSPGIDEDKEKEMGMGMFNSLPPTEPIIAGRRRSSVHSNGSSQGESRRGSGILHGPTRKSSGLLQVTLPVIDSPGIEEDKEVDMGMGMFNILPPTPMPDQDAVLETPAPAFLEDAFLEAPLMIKTSSQHSGISIRSVSSVGTPSSLSPLINPHFPTGGDSGIATPALSVQKTDLSMPSDPENPGQLLEQAFAESSQQRAKQSMGLEQMVFWHEGRADLHKVIEGMMVAVGKGGTVNVEACGPRSLLDKTKDVVQELSDLKAVWQGETRVVYHAETFGW